MDTTWSDRTRRIGVLLIVLGFVIVLFLARSVLISLVTAGLMVIIVGPLISFLHTRLRLPRGLAIVISYLVLLAILISLPFLFLAFMYSAVGLSIDLAEAISAGLDWLINTLENLRTIEIFGVTLDLSHLVDPALLALETLDIQSILPSPEQIISFISSTLGAVSYAAAKGLGVLISVGFALLLTFTYAIYMSADGAKMMADVAKLIPPGNEAEITTLAGRIGRVWTSYMRGQLGVMVAVGLITYIVAGLLGVPEPLALAVIAGVLEIIPHLGPILAAIPAVVLALFQGSTRFEINNLVFALIVVIAYILIQQVEDLVLTPKLQGKAVALPGLVVVVSVVVGLQVGGLLGAVIAIPTVATGREIFHYLYAKVLKQDPYPPQESPDAEPAAA
jgi:predicted PurR-regulated permease PerM